MVTESLPAASEDQRRAWGFYGTPRPPAKSGATTAQATFSAFGKQVGEVRYIVGWIADQMVRMGWRVKLDGSEAWTVTLPDGETVVSDPKTAVDIQTDPKHPSNASAKVLEAIGWNSRTVREVATNLFVAGEMHYAQDNDKWRVVSVIRSDREEILSRSPIKVRGLWPHPADPEAPDAPLFGVLSVLDDMLWLNRLSRSQSANRVGMRGIVGVADSWKVAGGSGESSDDFWDSFNAMLSRPMDDPEDVSPVGLVGAKDLVEPKDGGMKGLSWVIPNFPYDDKIDERMEKLVQRLAYGLPIPPEVLTGLQAQSKATAFQVEGATYRAHIEPVANLIADIATDTLKMFLADNAQVAVVPDPTTILSRRHSVQDVIEAFDRDAASAAYLREILGIPESAAPEDDELAQRAALRRTRAVPSDPGNDAAGEPIAAAAQMPGDGVEATSAKDQFDSVASERLSSVLHTIDSTALYELVGAAHSAVSRAHERLGIRVRTSAKLKAAFPTKLTNEELGREHVDAILTALGIDGEKIVSAALAPTLDWWGKRLEKAMQQTDSVFKADGQEPPAWPADAVDRSVQTLQAVLSNAVGGGPLLAAAGDRGLRESDLRQVLAVEAGKEGVAMSDVTKNALLGAGVQVIGHRWQWNPGRQGFTFDPHYARDHAAVFNVDGFVGDNASEWGALPGQGINGEYCMCTTRWLLRGADGKFMKERNH